MEEWIDALRHDATASTVDLPDRGKKRKAVVSLLLYIAYTLQPWLLLFVVGVVGFGKRGTQC